MRTGWPDITLGEVAAIERSTVKPDAIKNGETYVGLENLTNEGDFVDVASVDTGQLKSTKFRFGPQHVLYGKLRPYLAKIAAPDFGGVCSTDVLPILPGPSLDRRYLLHYLRTPAMVAHASKLAVGINLPRLSPKSLAKFPIPLPPIEEQRRIATVLDAADALRAKRRQARAKLDTLTQSIFIDMFGDLTRSQWLRVSFGSLLLRSLRNGVSPSKAGNVVGEVLTLSAITGSIFDGSAVKESTFDAALNPAKSVSVEDFLICRGNGNLSLVGRAKYPMTSMPSVAFPDTMIAAVCDEEVISRAYLSHVWNGRFVRRQIVRLARTTNGTHKINQTMIASVELSIPPIDLQRRFELAQHRVTERRSLLERHLENLDTLFASLQQRAFRGEL